jgi:hypothetical protein
MEIFRCLNLFKIIYNTFPFIIISPSHDKYHIADLL